MTVPDMAYLAARLTSILSVLMAMLSALMTGYGVLTRQFDAFAEKCKDSLAISRESRNVFIGFLVVLLFTVAPSVEVGGMSTVEAIADITSTYCRAMVTVLLTSFGCSVIGVFRGPLTMAAKEHISALRLNATVFAIAGMAMTYVTSFS